MFLVSGLESACSCRCGPAILRLVPEGLLDLKAQQFALASHTCFATYTTLIHLFGTRRPTRDNKMLPSQIDLHEPGYIFRVQQSPPPTP